MSRLMSQPGFPVWLVVFPSPRGVRPAWEPRVQCGAGAAGLLTAPPPGGGQPPGLPPGPSLLILRPAGGVCYRSRRSAPRGRWGTGSAAATGRRAAATTGG